MNIYEILNNPIINPSFVAIKLYPDKSEQQARVTFRMKLKGVQRNKFTPTEVNEIENILMEFLPPPK